MTGPLAIDQEGRRGSLDAGMTSRLIMNWWQFTAFVPLNVP